MRWRRRQAPVLAVLPPPAPSPLPPPFPEPWRSHFQAAECITVPVAIVVSIADPKTLAQIRRREQAKQDELRADVAANGIREPLQLVIDHLGRVCMQDGHHRTSVCEELRNAGLGPERLPIRFLRSDGVRMYAVEARDVLCAMLFAQPSDDRLRRAAEFALEAIEDGGARGWALGDAVCALRLALGLDVSADAAERMARIDPHLNPGPSGAECEVVTAALTPVAS